MKTAIKNILGIAVLGMSLAATSCSQYEPRGYEPVPALAKATGVEASVTGRSVTLNWTLPVTDMKIEAIRVSCDNGTPVVLAPDATSCTMKGQPMNQELMYTVKVQYENGYVSEGTSTMVVVPFVETKAAFLLLAEDAAALPDDDERAAAEWFGKQQASQYLHVSDLATVDPDLVSVIWIMVDREGLPVGWQNLPGGLADDATINALRNYSAAGGSIYLSNMATQLTVPLGMVPENMAPTLFGNGAGGEGSDVWTINPYLGWDFRNGSDQGFYDRTSHAIFKGLKLEDPNGYGYDSLPLIGPGHREDHNCMWDCNIYGKGSAPDVIKNFEDVTNSMVLATWGHVRDHCVAGLVDFFANSEHGRCVANGFAAYEWNQNSGPNIYQQNVEGLTLNIINYLK